jgi:hypothetical protein
MLKCLLLQNTGLLKQGPPLNAAVLWCFAELAFNKRVRGIEPLLLAWKAKVLLLVYINFRLKYKILSQLYPQAKVFHRLRVKSEGNMPALRESR